MASALAKAGRLKPEVRLGQAISDFQAELSSSQKANFRAQQTRATPPEIRDVMQLTAEINRSGGIGGRCYGTRLTNVLQAVQQFAALGDIVLGGTQNLLACGVWSLVRMTLLSIVSYATYFERLSSMLMAVGRSAPRYQLMGAIYPKSEVLQSYMLEYFIVLVKLCQHVVRLSQKSVLKKLTASLTDPLDSFQVDLDRWAASIREQVDLLSAQHLSLETKEASRFRVQLSRQLESQSHAKKLKARKRVLDACSVYDYENDWKKLRKIGNTTLTKNAVYTTWKQQLPGVVPQSQTLVCVGKLGSGKSVLLANIVDDLAMESTQTATLAYFFCQHDVSDSLVPRTVIGSLARQLLSSQADLDRATVVLGDKNKLSIDDLAHLLKDRLSSDHQFYFVLDGLMHCEGSARGIIIDTLRDLQNVIRSKLCISVRREPSDPLGELNELANNTVLCIPDDHPDIDEFINAELQRCIESGKLFVNDPLLVLEIQKKLREGAQGMFLWVALQIKALCLQNTDAGIRTAIANLPSDLFDIYRFILGSLRGEHKMKILGLVITACRPLSTEEIRDALSVVPGRAVWEPERRLNNINSTLACCGGLISIDEEDLTVRTVHHSVDAFLRVDGKKLFHNMNYPEQIMAEIIITYLNYGIFSRQVSTTRAPQIRAGTLTSSVIKATADSIGQSQRIALKLLRMGKSTDRDIGRDLFEAVASHMAKDNDLAPLEFSKYASLWWQEHIWFANLEKPGMQSLLTKMLEQHAIDKPDLCSRTPLSHASEHGFRDIVDWLLPHGASDQVDCFGMTPLHWAVKGRHVPVVTSLLNCTRFNANAVDKSGLAPIHLAIETKDEALLKSFVKCDGVDLSCGDADNRSPLMLTVMLDFVAGTEIILNARRFFQRDSSTVNFINYISSDTNGDTPLHLAAQRGSEEATGILLAYGLTASQINSRNILGRTPLWVAAAKGHRRCVQVLCAERRISHDIADNRSRTPFWAAAENGHHLIVQYMMGLKEIDVNRSDEAGDSAIRIAVENGHSPVVKLLANDERIDVNQTNARVESLLWTAVYEGTEDIVTILLEIPGIMPDRADNMGRTPLSIAACNGYDNIVRRLAPLKSVDVNHQSIRSRRTPLWFAAGNGRYDVVRSLAARAHIDLNCPDFQGRGPLWIAAYDCRDDVVRFLIDHANVDVNQRDEEGASPLWVAAERGHKTVVEILASANGVLLNIQKNGCNALWIAASKGHASIVQLLSSYEKVDIECKDQNCSTPLWVAASNGHAKAVEILIQRSTAVLNMENVSTLSPLAIAADKGHADVVSILALTPGVQLNHEDQNKETPLFKAAQKGYAEVVKVLLQYEEVKINPAVWTGAKRLTPLLVAVKCGHANVVRVLLDSPRLVQSLNDDDVEMALELARNGGFDDIHSSLVKVARGKATEALASWRPC